MNPFGPGLCSISPLSKWKMVNVLGNLLNIIVEQILMGYVLCQIPTK